MRETAIRAALRDVFVLSMLVGLPSLAFATCGTYENPCQLGGVGATPSPDLDPGWYMPYEPDQTWFFDDPYSGGNYGSSGGGNIIGTAEHDQFCSGQRSMFLTNSCQGTPSTFNAILDSMGLIHRQLCMLNQLDASTCWEQARRFEQTLCQYEDDIALEWACISQVHEEYTEALRTQMIFEQPALHHLGSCRTIIATMAVNQCPL